MFNTAFKQAIQYAQRVWITQGAFINYQEGSAQIFILLSLFSGYVTILLAALTIVVIWYGTCGQYLKSSEKFKSHYETQFPVSELWATEPVYRCRERNFRYHRSWELHLEPNHPRCPTPGLTRGTVILYLRTQYVKTSVTSDQDIQEPHTHHIGHRMSLWVPKQCYISIRLT